MTPPKLPLDKLTVGSNVTWHEFQDRRQKIISVWPMHIYHLFGRISLTNLIFENQWNVASVTRIQTAVTTIINFVKQNISSWLVSWNSLKINKTIFKLQKHRQILKNHSTNETETFSTGKSLWKKCTSNLIPRLRQAEPGRGPKEFGD